MGISHGKIKTKSIFVGKGGVVKICKKITVLPKKIQIILNNSPNLSQFFLIFFSTYSHKIILARPVEADLETVKIDYWESELDSSSFDDIFMLGSMVTMTTI